MEKIHFYKRPVLLTRLLVSVFVCVGLMIVDSQTTWLSPVRYQLGRIATYLFELSNQPIQWFQTAQANFQSRDALIAENEKLKLESLMLRSRLQKVISLTEQNVRLKELLNSASGLDDPVVIAELIGMDTDPALAPHRIIVDKGEADGIFVGQPVLDAQGLMGQVIEIMPNSARVLLLTDPSLGVPVTITRNGVRAVAYGMGLQGQLDIRFVSETEDVRAGDVLITSGLGDLFPQGYPVAKVQQVNNDTSSSPFMTIKATPTALLTRSRYVLLVLKREGSRGLAIPDNFMGPPKPLSNPING